MATPPSVTSDIVTARWAKRVLTYGATIVAVLSAGLYFLFQTANKTALSPFGLDPSGYAGSPAEIIGGGLGSLFVFALIIFVLYWPIGWPVGKLSGWLAGKYLASFGRPLWLRSLEAWITSDPVKRPSRALMASASFTLPLVIFLLFWIGSSIGGWRVSQAEWLVSANDCASGCFVYKQDGRASEIIGRPIAANGTRMAIVVGRGQIETVDIAKVISVRTHTAKAPSLPKEASWWDRFKWWMLDVFNANW